MIKRNYIFLAVTVLILSFLACGFGGGGGDDDEDDVYLISFPLREGVSWTYNCTETGPDTQYVLIKTMDGTRTFPADTLGWVQPAAPPATLHWYRQFDSDSSFFFDDGYFVWMGQVDPTIATMGGHSFVPLRVIPRKYSIGDTFSTVVFKKAGFLETHIYFNATVAGRENVTVPAGTFENCLRLEAELVVEIFSDTTLSTIWCANGVGVVKRDDYYETADTLHTYYEELSSYDLNN